jgi:magnesium chelatase subunit I
MGLSESEPDALRASAGEFILEGLYALRRIGRDEELGFRGESRSNAAPAEDEASEIDPAEFRRKRNKQRYN